jgi:hypothetical protein
METANRRSSSSSSSMMEQVQFIIVQSRWVQTLYDEETGSLTKKQVVDF